MGKEPLRKEAIKDKDLFIVHELCCRARYLIVC